MRLAVRKTQGSFCLGLTFLIQYQRASAFTGNSLIGRGVYSRARLIADAATARPVAANRSIISASRPATRNMIAAAVAPIVMPSKRDTASIPPAAPARDRGADARSVRLFGAWKKPNPKPQTAILQAISPADASTLRPARQSSPAASGRQGKAVRPRAPRARHCQELPPARGTVTRAGLTPSARLGGGAFSAPPV